MYLRAFVISQFMFTLPAFSSPLTSAIQENIIESQNTTTSTEKIISLVPSNTLLDLNNQSILAYKSYSSSGEAQILKQQNGAKWKIKKISFVDSKGKKLKGFSYLRLLPDGRLLMSFLDQTTSDLVSIEKVQKSLASVIHFRPIEVLLQSNGQTNKLQNMLYSGTTADGALIVHEKEKDSWTKKPMFICIENGAGQCVAENEMTNSGRHIVALPERNGVKRFIAKNYEYGSESSIANFEVWVLEDGKYTLKSTQTFPVNDQYNNLVVLPNGNLASSSGNEIIIWKDNGDFFTEIAKFEFNNFKLITELSTTSDSRVVLLDAGGNLSVYTEKNGVISEKLGPQEKRGAFVRSSSILKGNQILLDVSTPGNLGAPIQTLELYTENESKYEKEVIYSYIADSVKDYRDMRSLLRFDGGFLTTHEGNVVRWSLKP